MGGKSKKSKQTTSITLDPQTQALNQLRLGQEQALEPLRAAGRGVMGGVLNPNFGLPGTQSNLAAGLAYLNANPDVAAVYGNGQNGGPWQHFQDFGQAEGRQWGNAVAPTMLRSPYTLSTGETIPGVNAQDLYNSMPGLRNMQFASPEEAFAASRLASLTDVSGLQNAARINLDQIVAPQLMSQAIAQGMGRGGASLEALAKQGAQFALPIEQARQANEQNLAQYVGSRGERRQALAGVLATPSTQFTGAPTTTVTQKGGGGKGGGGDGGSPIGSILGMAGTVVGSIYGGPAGGMAGGAIGSGLGNMISGGGGKSSGGGDSNVQPNGLIEGFGAGMGRPGGYGGMSGPLMSSGSFYSSPFSSLMSGGYRIGA